METRKLQMTWVEARQVLGVAAGADAQTVRQAYLEAVRRHPPDQDPEGFERIRDAYAMLKDPRAAAEQILTVDPPFDAPLTQWLDRNPRTRKFVGPDAWLAVLKERQP